MPNMATTAVMNPTSIFQNRTPSHPPPPYPHHSSTSNQVHPLSALTSPSHATDSRREEPKEPASQRQSLPSIHEALADPPSTYPAYTSASSHSYTPAYAPSALTPTIRQFPPEPSQYQPQFASTHSHRNSPPQPVQPPSSSFPRSDFTQRNYPDAIRQPSALRAGLPTQTQPNSRAPRPDSDSRYYDRVETSNGYDAPSSEQYRGYPTAPQQSQAVNAYSTHNTSQDAYQQRYAPGADHPDDLASKKEEPGYLRSGFASVLKRNLDYWDEERSVKEVNSIQQTPRILILTCRQLNNSAQRLSQMTGEYLSSASRWGNTPNRGNPALVNLNALREEHMKIGHCIEEIQSSFDQQEAIVADQQSREQLGRANSTYDRDDYDGWAGDPKEQGMMMGGPGPNKRRGVGFKRLQFVCDVD